MAMKIPKQMQHYGDRLVILLRESVDISFFAVLASIVYLFLTKSQDFSAFAVLIASNIALYMAAKSTARSASDDSWLNRSFPVGDNIVTCQEIIERHLTVLLKSDKDADIHFLLSVLAEKDTNASRRLGDLIAEGKPQQARAQFANVDLRNHVLTTFMTAGLIDREGDGYALTEKGRTYAQMALR